jgi:hypothetical protein
MRASCYPRLQSGLGAAVQCRGTRPNPRQLLSPVNDLSFGQGRESGFITELVVIQGAENRKNRDEFINYTVRVSLSDVYKGLFNAVCLSFLAE